MNRVWKVLRALHHVIKEYNEEIPDERRDQPADWERIHSASCARLGMMMALERGIDPILGGVACACHDYGRILTGEQKGHAERGFEPVQEFLRGFEYFTEDEIQQIATAVKNHSSKALIQDPLSELVKDVDIIDFYQYGSAPTRKEQEDRLVRLLGHPMDEQFKW
ncbi:MAG: HD domain-containing protein [Eubacterium sp.]|nr:HD domain-containing protein [Candidatus Colimonas fimequi]